MLLLIYEGSSLINLDKYYGSSCRLPFRASVTMMKYIVQAYSLSVQAQTHIPMVSKYIYFIDPTVAI